MRITIISVGKKHMPELADAIAVYEKRLASKHKLIWKLITPAVANEAQQIKEESQKIIDAIKPKDFVILLDETGDILTNQQLAKVFDTTQSSGSTDNIVFIIGGAYGVDGSVKSRANVVWGLSKLVFPHQLVRLILVEQLYRTVTLLESHPYHHQ